jgi:hypothetical protein
MLAHRGQDPVDMGKRNSRFDKARASVFFLPGLQQRAVPIPPRNSPTCPNRLRQTARRGTWCNPDLGRRRTCLRFKLWPANIRPREIAAELGRGVNATVIKAYEVRIPLKINSRWESEHSNLDPGPAGMDLTK